MAEYVFRENGKKVFWCFSDMSGYEFLIEIEDAGKLEIAMELAEKELEKWGNVSEIENPDEYNYYYHSGYVEVVSNILNTNGIKHSVFGRV